MRGDSDNERTIFGGRLIRVRVKAARDRRPATASDSARLFGRLVRRLDHVGPGTDPTPGLLGFLGRPTLFLKGVLGPEATSGGRFVTCSQRLSRLAAGYTKRPTCSNALPKSAQPAARRAIVEIRDAEDRSHALEVIEAFKADYQAKWPKAVAKIVDDAEQLLAFFDFPAEHWIHLKTTNPIDSTFATVRLRTNVTKGPGSKTAGLAMAYKLIEAAQYRWRAVNAPHLVALVRAGAKFDKGVIVERTTEQKTEVAA